MLSSTCVEYNDSMTVLARLMDMNFSSRSYFGFGEIRYQMVRKMRFLNAIVRKVVVFLRSIV